MANAQLSLETPDGPMPTYEAAPDVDAKGGIVVVQEAFGVTRHIEEVAERLAGDGWHSVAPALFHRQGAPALGYDDFAAVMPLMQELSAPGIGMDVSAALEYLETAGYSAVKCGVVGFCMGGTVAFHTGVEHRLGAAVTFYGGGVVEGRFGFDAMADRAPSLQTPWLGLFGDLDKGIPPDQVEALRTAAAKAAVATEVVRYPDAEHGFNCNDRPAVYNPAVAADAWGRTLAWFDTHIGAQPDAQRHLGQGLHPGAAERPGLDDVASAGYQAGDQDAEGRQQAPPHPGPHQQHQHQVGGEHTPVGEPDHHQGYRPGPR